MAPDYRKLGLKCGIEIHQQLDTKKLFCSCHSKIRDISPDVIVRRKLRAVAGEVGDIDPAALHEFLRNKEIIYQAYSDTNCLVELDEEPPHPLNQEALDIALEVSLLLNAQPVDELQVMRKTVIDGSNTSGFQRTILVAMDGYIETNSGKVGIPTICLEEDAARKISEKGNTTTYRLDRLGIPLIEIGTSPDIKTPEQAREVAEKLGMILRATGEVKRGLGTIRQDLNVSIREGERIEVKGVQDLRLISKVVKLEVERQLMLIEVAKELRKRNLSMEELKPNFPDMTEIFKNTKSKLISSLLKDKNSKAMAVKLLKFKGLLKGRLGPELAQYARATAGVKGIFHSDELPGYGITEQEVKEVAKKLSIGKDDAFALVIQKEETARKALIEVLQRCKIARNGVPEETRRIKDDGTTEFMRPLPGSARMYPETDEPLILITKERISDIRKRLSKLPEERLQEFIGMGLSAELANQLVRSRFVNEFEKFVKEFKSLKSSVIATTLIATPKDVKRRYNVDTDAIEIPYYEKILKAVDEGKISKDVIPEILADVVKNPDDLDIILKKKETKISEKEIEKVIDKIIKDNIEFIRSNKERAAGPLIGKAMVEFKGRVDGKTVSRMVMERIRVME